MPSQANLPTGSSSCLFPGVIMSNPFYDLYRHEPNKDELQSKLLVYEFEHITMEGRICVIMISFSKPGFMDQRCSETPQFVINKMDMRGHHSAEGHCYLQYPQLYSTLFEITNWIDNVSTTIICSHTMSTNGFPLKTTLMAPSCELFGSQQHLEGNVGASNNNDGNRARKDTQFGNPRIKFILHRGIVTRLRSHHFQALPSFTTLPHSTWHQASNHALVVQPKDIRVMGHRGKDTTSPKVAMVDLKCSPLGNSPDRGRHFQAHLKFLQPQLATIQ